MSSFNIKMNATQYINCSLEQLKKVWELDKKTNEAGDDATWILTSAFIIFTMQSGFGLLEAGSVSAKNEANIMMKNAIDVLFGGLSYWMCGFGFSFGVNEYIGPLTAFMGVGDFFTGTIDHTVNYGELYSKYFFQMSFATTATTIVSGSMAERTNLKAYMFFSFINTFSYVFPAHWIWDERGFLSKLGVVDIAGCGPVHMVGGVAALVATLMLKPRTGIFDDNVQPPAMASPTNMLLGTFMLWWGWLGFNCGSTFGVSGIKWKLASRTSVITINASIGGGLFGILYSYKLTKRYNGKLDISSFISSLLGGLVGITAVCSVCQPWLGFIIGFVGGAISCYGARLMEYLKIDDPVQCIPVHFFGAVYGMIVVGLFTEKEEGLSRYSGVFFGGPWKFLGYQMLSCLVIILWTAITTFAQLYITDLMFGLRMSVEDEMKGADKVEHGISQNLSSGHCERCHGRSSSIVLKSPTVIVNKTYARKIFNGNQGIINFGLSNGENMTVTDFADNDTDEVDANIDEIVSSCSSVSSRNKVEPLKIVNEN